MVLLSILENFLCEIKKTLRVYTLNAPSCWQMSKQWLVGHYTHLILCICVWFVNYDSFMLKAPKPSCLFPLLSFDSYFKCTVLNFMNSKNDHWGFCQVVAGLWAAAVIGSWCNFLTVLYIGESSWLSCQVMFFNLDFYLFPSHARGKIWRTLHNASIWVRHLEKVVAS